jgi:hypothetical protein
VIGEPTNHQGVRREHDAQAGTFLLQLPAHGGEIVDEHAVLRLVGGVSGIGVDDHERLLCVAVGHDVLLEEA